MFSRDRDVFWWFCNELGLTDTGLGWDEYSALWKKCDSNKDGELTWDEIVGPLIHFLIDHYGSKPKSHTTRLRAQSFANFWHGRQNYFAAFPSRDAAIAQEAKYKDPRELGESVKSDGTRNPCCVLS
jgi:hypothetical protein